MQNWVENAIDTPFILQPLLKRPSVEFSWGTRMSKKLQKSNICISSSKSLPNMCRGSEVLSIVCGMLETFERNFKLFWNSYRTTHKSRKQLKNPQACLANFWSLKYECWTLQFFSTFASFANHSHAPWIPHFKDKWAGPSNFILPFDHPRCVWDLGEWVELFPRSQFIESRVVWTPRDHSYCCWTGPEPPPRAA